jgi:hypothetical protein
MRRVLEGMQREQVVGVASFLLLIVFSITVGETEKGLRDVSRNTLPWVL